MKTTNYAEILQKRQAQILKMAVMDIKKMQQYQEYMSAMSIIHKEKFGNNPQWEKISIEDKTYHGWMKPYMLAADSVINGRWAYWYDIKITQEVKNKPIPQLKFYKSYDIEFQAASSMIKKCLEPPQQLYYGGYELFTMFVDFLLYSLGSPLVMTLPEKINNELREYWYKEFKPDYLLMFPADYFVNIAAEMYSGKFNVNQFYPTPANVVELMTKITYDSIDPELAKYSVSIEPAAGSGTMVLYQSNYTLRQYAMDIDALMVKLCTLNGFFYIPWLVAMDDVTESLLAREYEALTNKSEVIEKAKNIIEMKPAEVAITKEEIIVNEINSIPVSTIKLTENEKGQLMMVL